MDHHQWVRARFDAYAAFVGQQVALSRMDHYSARELRARIQVDIAQLDERLGKIDGVVMDNGQMPADHHP